MQSPQQQLQLYEKSAHRHHHTPPHQGHHMHHHHQHHQRHSGGHGVGGGGVGGGGGDSNGDAAMMETPANVQSMDWLIENKDHIYLLAQFWQQVSDGQRTTR